MGFKRFKPFRQDVEPLTSTDLAFYREAVFLLKTYFFIYLGISIHFNGIELALIALAMIVVIFTLRTLLVRHVLRDPDIGLRDATLAANLAPKGLAAAVLAAVPLQYGIPGAELIRDTTYMVVLVSISVCALLVALYPSPPLQGLFRFLLNKKPGGSPGF